MATSQKQLGQVGGQKTRCGERHKGAWPREKEGCPSKLPKGAGRAHKEGWRFLSGEWRRNNADGGRK